jgi:hypothetical protein
MSFMKIAENLTERKAPQFRKGGVSRAKGALVKTYIPH